MDDKKKNMILIPPKFGNAHYVLSEKAIFHYKQNTLYDRKSQFTINWQDKHLNLNGHVKNQYYPQEIKNEKKVLIFGGSGFVGINLTKFLAKKILK